jgi:hypothetical protein
MTLDDVGLQLLLETMALAQQRRLAVPCYIVAVAFMVLPVLDQLMQLVPRVHIHDAGWRFGALGLLSNILLLPLLGMTLAFAISAIFEHRTWQRVLSIVAVVGIVLIVVAIGMFALDAIQVRSLMRAERLSSWTLATLTATAKYLLAAVTLAFFAKAGFAASTPRKTPAKDRAAGLIVGRPTKPSSQEDTESKSTSET